jgi:hypothetical protein
MILFAMDEEDSLPASHEIVTRVFMGSSLLHCVHVPYVLDNRQLGEAVALGRTTRRARGGERSCDSR